MFSLFFQVVLALGWLATPANAQPRIDEGPFITPASGKCIQTGNQFARVQDAAIGIAANWPVGSFTDNLRASLGIPFCWLDADPAYPDVLRSAYPLVSTPNRWLVIYYRPSGQYVGHGFLYSKGV